MTNRKFEFTKHQKFLRGLLFISTGVFLLARFVAQGTNPFFLGVMWLTGAIALGCLVLFLWNVFQ